ncbi:hypothetical protein GGTG_09946 [Gaeumannomyces tritici R3-111a-1]|uniref:Enoyl reductase (ER) domain-containing protein n=1 Tax=Gaeumannomyces tritici (strain R3-111a-1) TaxID=644352 RepID=J3P8W2_GAET3|nr:hypothetical protein GGTG_09946 [Gaeumannomyces tritici R3-111a-1]EJT73096.1 hypothetical protein GGTG_09946 [Gaeumannomyces tritici R3-111a-1]
MSAPTTTRAVVVKGLGQAAIEEVPTPRLRDGYILIKPTAVALNPTDWKHVEGPFGAGRVGCDYAGVVVEVGKGVTKDFKPGDRIAGLCHGSNKSAPEGGAFGEYIVAKGDIQLKIPDSLSDEEASTLGVGVVTCGQGLYQALKLPLPSDEAGVKAAAGTPILIYGGSTATGILGIQYAKLSGFRVLTTASPRNFDYLRSLGADEVFDYGDAAGWPGAVREATGGKLRHAWDCIASADSARGCAAAMDSEPGADGGAKYSALLYVDPAVIKEANPAMAPPMMTLGYTAVGEAFSKWAEYPAKPEDFEHAKMFVALTDGLLAEGKLKTATPEADRGGRGLEGVLAGLQELKAGKVSGYKLVYHM